MKKRFLTAFAVAPLATPILYWAGSLALSLTDPYQRHLALKNVFGGIGYVILIGAPIAYVATLVAAVPAVWLVRHAGRWTPAALMALGGLAGLLTAVVLHPYLGRDLFRIPLPPLAGAALGALSAGVFWWLAPHSERTGAG